jgi:hypothetical protein
LSRIRNKVALNERIVYDSDTRVGLLTKEYHSPTGIPGCVGYERGRAYWTFIADTDLLAVKLAGRHGRNWPTLAESADALLPLVCRRPGE